jgi:hypothetical protein
VPAGRAGEDINECKDRQAKEQGKVGPLDVLFVNSSQDDKAASAR